MTAVLTAREQALKTDFQNRPPTAGWPAYCARNETDTRTNIDNRGFQELPTAEYYSSGVYTRESCKILVDRLNVGCGAYLGPVGVVTQYEREFDLINDYAAHQANYSGICGANARTVLNNNGFSDLPVDSAESVSQMCSRLGICSGGGTPNTSTSPPTYDGAQGRIGNI